METCEKSDCDRLAPSTGIRGLPCMFEHDTRSVLLMRAQCVLLRGVLLVQPRPVLQLVAAVRIPGGLTPP